MTLNRRSSIHAALAALVAIGMPILAPASGAAAGPLAARAEGKAELRAAISERLPGMGILLVDRGGQRVFEYYGDGRSEADFVPFASATIGVVSALYGAALEKGLAPPVDARIEQVLGRVRGNDNRFHALTVRHFLTMTAGLDEFYPAFDEPLTVIYKKRMFAEPGKVFALAEENADLLQALVMRQSGRASLDLARELLLGPLGIEEWSWETAENGVLRSLAGSFRGDDALKFGRLYLADGLWEGRRVLPAGWAAESFRPSGAERLDTRFGKMGYLWWVHDEGPFPFACTAGGETTVLYVLPTLDAVVLLWNLKLKEGEGSSYSAYDTFIGEVVGPLLESGSLR